MAHYQRPDWFTQHLFNPLVALSTRLGLSLFGSRVLAVRGRKSGEWHMTPVNPLSVGEARYLVAPRGNTQWVRNLRAAGGGELRAGRKTERFTVEEVPATERIPLLREYLRKWKWEAGQFFDGRTASSTDEELREIASKHPVFRIRTA